MMVLPTKKKSPISSLLQACRDYQEDYAFFKNDHHLAAEAVANACTCLLSHLPENGALGENLGLVLYALYDGLCRYLIAKQSEKFLSKLNKISSEMDSIVDCPSNKFFVLSDGVFNALNSQQTTDTGYLVAFVKRWPITDANAYGATDSLSWLPNDVFKHNIEKYLSRRDLQSLACVSKSYFFKQPEEAPSWPFHVDKVLSCSSVTFFQSYSGHWFACENNVLGQLGLGHNNYQVNVPTRVTLPGGETIASVVTFSKSTLFMAQSGNVYACGDNWCGQLGLEHHKCAYFPTLVTLPGGEAIASVVRNGFSTLFMTQSGNVYACENNNHGELGLGHNGKVYLGHNGKVYVHVPTPISLSFIKGQNQCIEALMNAAFSKGLTNTAGFLGGLFLAYYDTSLKGIGHYGCVKNLGEALLKRPSLSLSMCLGLINRALMPLAPHLIKTGGDKEQGLLYLWKMAHDKTFQEKIQKMANNKNTVSKVEANEFNSGSLNKNKMKG